MPRGGLGGYKRARRRAKRDNEACNIYRGLAAPPPRPSCRACSRGEPCGSWSVALRPAKRVSVRACGAPILRAPRADFGRYVPPLCALRARNMPAFGGRGHEKAPRFLQGSSRVGGSIHHAVSKTSSRPRQVARKSASNLGVFSRICANNLLEHDKCTIIWSSFRSAPMNAENTIGFGTAHSFAALYHCCALSGGVRVSNCLRHIRAAANLDAITAPLLFFHPRLS